MPSASEECERLMTELDQIRQATLKLEQTLEERDVQLSRLQEFIDAEPSGVPFLQMLLWWTIGACSSTMVIILISVCRRTDPISLFSEESLPKKTVIPRVKMILSPEDIEACQAEFKNKPMPWPAPAPLTTNKADN